MCAEHKDISVVAIIYSGSRIYLQSKDAPLCLRKKKKGSRRAIKKLIGSLGPMPHWINDKVQIIKKNKLKQKANEKLNVKSRSNRVSWQSNNIKLFEKFYCNLKWSMPTTAHTHTDKNVFEMMFIPLCKSKLTGSKWICWVSLYSRGNTENT